MLDEGEGGYLSVPQSLQTQIFILQYYLQNIHKLQLETSICTVSLICN